MWKIEYLLLPFQGDLHDDIFHNVSYCSMCRTSSFYRGAEEFELHYCCIIRNSGNNNRWNCLSGSPRKFWPISRIYNHFYRLFNHFDLCYCNIRRKINYNPIILYIWLISRLFLIISASKSYCLSRSNLISSLLLFIGSIPFFFLRLLKKLMINCSLSKIP